MLHTPELNMVLYYALLREWLRVGSSEFAIRSLSVIFGIAAIPALYKLGQRLFGTTAGLIAAALLAAHSFHIRYSQEARAYSLQVLLLILATDLFCRINDAPGRKRYWLAYILLSAASVYCHIFVVLVIAAHWAAAGASRLRAIGAKSINSIAVGVALLFAPFALHMLLEEQQGLTWIPRPTLMFFLGTMRSLTGSGDGARTFSSLALTVLYAACCAGGVWTSYLRVKHAAPENEKFAVRLTFLWIVLPISVTLAVSLLGKPVFFSRYLLMCVPAIALLATQGLAAFANCFAPRKVALVVATAVMIVLSLIETHRYFQSFPSYGNQWEAVVRYILANERPRDAVAISVGLEPFEYYERKEMQPNVRPPTITFPLEIGQGDRSFRPTVVLQQAALDHDRVWLVFPATQEDNIRANIPESFRPVNETIFSAVREGELRIILFVRQ